MDTSLKIRRFFGVIAGIFLLISLPGCEKDGIDDERIAENTAFYNLMKDWYYWYREMPEIDPKQYDSPYELLEAVRFRPLDRWSYITSKEEFDAYFLESRFIGYGFGSAFDQDGRLRVRFVYNNTHMQAAGVQRGWIIDAINGLVIRPGVNISQLLGPNEIGISNTFRFILPDGSVQTQILPKQDVSMNSVLYADILDIGSKKTAYLVLNSFTSSTTDELLPFFQNFQQNGVHEFILDLRYNGGGQTSVSNLLASMIGGGKVANKVYAEYQYNDKQAAERNFTETFRNTTYSLDIPRLVVLTTRSTASASEMLINGLKPFMPVVIIGDNTYGKPMGMNAWYYGEKYAFVPITFKTSNANGEGDFFDGFPANHRVSDDLTRPFGDPEEAMLKAAIHFVGTDAHLPSKVMETTFVQPQEQMQGLRRIIGAY